METKKLARRSPQLVISLDGTTKETAIKIAAKLAGKVWGFKINDLLFENGISITELKKFGKVFADAKFHDIPNTVANSITKLDAAGADLISIHAAGGVEMMKAARKAAVHSKVLAVTILTSLDENMIRLIFGKSIKNTFLKLVQDANIAGMDGIVCSPQELKYLKEKSEFKHLLRVVPGIRPAWYHESDDQQRILTPKEAVNLGADLLVIGRPILKAKNPAKAVEKILDEIYK